MSETIGTVIGVVLAIPITYYALKLANALDVRVRLWLRNWIPR